VPRVTAHATSVGGDTLLEAYRQDCRLTGQPGM